jgi:AraC-like DNA-binding protein
LQVVAHLPHKDDWVHKTFDTMNFSLILDGEGAFRMDGRDWPVRAPMVITQWPGIPVRYGPSQWWEELYLIYPAESLPVFEAQGYAVRRRPVWPIANPARVTELLARLRELARDISTPGRVDELDRLVDELVLATYVGQSFIPRDERHERIERIRRDLLGRLDRDVDAATLAEQAGMSEATFRRVWARHVGPPPGQFLARARIQQACRLLVETDEPVGRIATEVGYEDALYFSRKFRGMVGMSPRDYRRQNRVG